MVRTKFSQRKTSGPDPKSEQPPPKIIKRSADNESEALECENPSIDQAAVILDLDKVQMAMKTLPKIPKIIKKEPADNSEVKATEENSLVQVNKSPKRE